MTSNEQRDCAPPGKLVYDGGSISPFLAEHVERFLHEYVVATPGLELLQRTIGHGCLMSESHRHGADRR
jgi:hypothetical protein